MDTKQEFYQTDSIKKNYYNHLTFIDNLAKTYGESGLFSKSILYSTFFGSCFLFTISPVFFFIGALFTSVMLFLQNQYASMELRLGHLITHIQQTEIDLKALSQSNIALKQEAMQAADANLKVSKVMAALQDQLHELQGKFRESVQKANEASQSIEYSVIEVNALVQTAESSVVETVALAKDFVMDLKNLTQLTKSIGDTLEHIEASDANLKQVLEETDALDALIAERLGMGFDDFRSQYEKNLLSRLSMFDTGISDEVFSYSVQP